MFVVSKLFKIENKFESGSGWLFSSIPLKQLQNSDESYGMIELKQNVASVMLIGHV